MPASEKLWTAPSAQAWSEAYLAQGESANSRLPNVALCMRDSRVMLEASIRLDIKFSKHILLSMFWRQIWDCRQLSASGRTSSIDPGTVTTLASSHWRQDLGQSIRHFSMASSDVDPFSPQAGLIYEHLLLNIYVSFEEMSRFSGKEGMQEARRALPLLRDWAQSQDSRQAVWHAGQIVKEASKFMPGRLRDLPAVALYHAGLTLWAYGVLSTKAAESHRAGTRSTDYANVSSLAKTANIAVLDGEESIATQKFIGVGRAVPAIHRRSVSGQLDPSSGDGRKGLIFLDCPKDVMEAVIGVLQRNHGITAKYRPISSLVENLVRLMSDLSHAASKINVK